MTSPTESGSPRSAPEEATIVIADAAPTESEGMALDGPGTRAVDDAYRRLGWIAAIGVGVFVVTLALMLGVHFLTSGNIVVTLADIAWTAVALVGAASMLFVCHRGMLPRSWFVPVALVFEFFMAIMFSSGLLGWQDRVATAGLGWLETSSRPPWFLGAGEVPWVVVWMILFATLVPLKPRQHFWGALGASLTVLIFPFLSLWLYGVPEILAPRFGEVFFRVMAFLLLPTLFGMWMAYYAAKRIYGLRQDLSRAREMGSYHMVEKLGEGGMGEVWKAEHRMLARPAAIKLIHAEALKDSEDSGTVPGSYVTRFEREVQATAQLQSPHTIEVYDYGITENGTFYYVMELLDGLDLQEAIRQFGPMPPERVVMIIRQACHSLAEAHQRGLVHRDIKPANVFLCRLGRDYDFVKVLDFGLVKRTGAKMETHLTLVGTFAGTPAYAPPEMAGAGVDEVDGRADIYSLGCVAYWLLTGRTVFSADNALQMLVKHASEEPKPPSAHTIAPLPVELDDIILQCLAKEPADRIATAAELSQRLGAISWSDPWTDDRAQSWWREHRSDAAATS